MSNKFFNPIPKHKTYKDKANYKRYAQSHHSCEVCGAVAQDCHHIALKGMGGANVDDRDSNLIALCRAHHELAHGNDPKFWRDKFLSIKGLL